MRAYDDDIFQELQKETAKLFYLAEFQLNQRIYCYTDCDIEITYQEHSYLPMPFAVQAIIWTADLSVDRIVLEFSNIKKWLSSMLLSENAANKPAILSFVCINDKNRPIAVEELFRGVIAEWKLKEDKSSIEIVNELILWRKKALRTAQSSCRWIFKSGECRYRGAEDWCDQTWDRCTKLNNTANFGGFRFLPAMMEKKIWWGKIPS